MTGETLVAIVSADVDREDASDSATGVVGLMAEDA
jgi:hypothetical protein